jgi:hypothetical protein
LADVHEELVESARQREREGEREREREREREKLVRRDGVRGERTARPFSIIANYCVPSA